jgi:hypothetical protein
MLRNQRPANTTYSPILVLQPVAHARAALRYRLWWRRSKRTERTQCGLRSSIPRDWWGLRALVLASECSYSNALERARSLSTLIWYSL